MSLDLKQTVRGGMVYDAYDGVVDIVHEDGSLSRKQEVTGILEENLALRNESDRFKGFRFAPSFRKVASIPVAAVDIAKAQGLDILNDPDDLKRFLNDSNNKAFRTTNEVV